MRLFYNDDYNFWDQNWLIGGDPVSNLWQTSDVMGPAQWDSFSPIESLAAQTNAAPLSTDMSQLNDPIALNMNIETSSVFDGSHLDGTNGFVFLPEAIYLDNLLAYGIHDIEIGDINGDGIADILIGHPAIGSGLGSAFTLFGVDSTAGGSFSSNIDLTTLNGSNGFQFSGVDPDGINGSLIGNSIASGDFNGDGIDDLIVGHDDSNHEKIYVVFGDDTAPFPADMDIDNLTSHNVLEIDFVEYYFHIGEQVTIGDFDGDGIDDIVVRENGTASYDGVYIFYGDTNFGNGYEKWDIYDQFGNLQLDGTDGVHISNIDTSWYMESIGDINGDGNEDIWVTPDISQIGSYIILGETRANSSASVDFSEFNSVNLSGFRWFIYNEGYAPVQAMGDINNDGIDDFYVVHRNQSYGFDSYIIYGNSNFSDLDVANFGPADGIFIPDSGGVKAGDMDNDGYMDFAISAQDGVHIVFGSAQGFGDTIDLENLAKFEWDGISVRLTHLVYEDPTGYFGQGGDVIGAHNSIMEFADVNNDGYDDLVTGYSVIFGGANFGEVNNIYGDNSDNNLSVLTGTPYVDAIWGYDGDDIIEGLGDADWINGGAGIDRVIYTQSTEGVKVDLQLGNNVFGHAECDTLLNIEEVGGSNFRDIIKGNQVDNQLFGLGGNDTLFGRNGHDTIYGDGGNDFINAGGGHDYVEGGMGGDKIQGGSGNDTLYGNDGNDFLWGGAGIDIIDGGAGVDRALYTTSSGVTINLATGIHAGDALDDMFISIERYYGSNDVDTLIGDGGINWLYGAGGADYIEGGAERDYLYGGAGNDEIYGGSGDDRIYGDSGFDNLYGEGGKDIFYGGGKNNNYFGGDGIDFVNYSKVVGGNSFGIGFDLSAGVTDYGSAGDTYTSIERFIGSNSRDIMYGGADDDFFRGGGGDDLMKGGAGFDKLYGDAGADRFIFEMGHEKIRIMDYDKSENDYIDLRDYGLGFADFADLDANSDFREVINAAGEWAIIDFGTEEIWIETTYNNVDYTTFDQDILFLF